ncbi:IV fiber 55.8 kDa protein [Human mastadenovirus C]|uniref:IV fiber 55.8 kDa protein n=2 Tax=Human mastadenovirus C TaxID=129951 RepID=E1ARS6_9ADEN|nr:IV fiber 55.8 kDa protein [Human mastadenovirus C]
MKRARPSEDTFNPVYPYDTETGPPTVPFLTPPFVSPNGFQESPPGVLSLRLSEPLVTSHGMLALKMGSGLSLDQAGNLTSNTITVSQPLKKTKSNITLETSAPLTVSSGALTMATTSPLVISDNTLTMQSQAPLTVQDSKLSIATKEPLTVLDGKLALQTSAPLSATGNNALTITTSPPLTTANGSLAVTMENPLYNNNGKLGLKIGGPLQVATDSHALTLGTGQGVAVHNNLLHTKVTGAIGFDTSGNMELKTGDGLYVDSAGPNQKLHINLNTTKGLAFDNTAITINAGKGLEFETDSSNGNPIKTKIGSGIQYDTNGAMVAKLGTGLSFDSSGAITMGSINNDRLTLWTTPDPSPNCRIASDKDCKLTLALTKCGSQILGTVSALAVSGNMASINGTLSSVNLVLRFDDNGVLMSNSSLDKQYWNFRNGDSTNGQPYTYAVGFMPNLKAYPKTQSKTAKSNIVSQVYLNGDKSKPLHFTITLNGTDETNQVSKYSISFSWSWNSGQYTNDKFATNSYTFSYISQE